MSNALHSKQQPADGIHGVVAWVYADATARLAATGFTTDDVYRLAYQVSTGTLWILQDDSPITWSELASGGSQQLNKVEVTIVKSTAGTLPVGKAIYVTSWDLANNRAVCELAQANSPTTVPCAGIVSVVATDVAAGKAMLLGVLNNIDTSAMTALAPTYLSASVAGDITTTPPPGPYVIQALGQCLRSHATTGVLGVNILSYRAIDYATTPNQAGTGAAGTSNQASPSDHVHPVYEGPSTLSVRNETGLTLPKGRAVYASGWSIPESLTLVALADKDSLSTMPVIGFVAANINNNSNGSIVLHGILTGLNTSAFAQNGQIVLGDDGNFVGGPYWTSGFSGNIQPLGWVARVDASSGSIFVNIAEILPLTPEHIYTAESSEHSKSVDPTVDDDADAGYYVGSRWINVSSDKEFVCLDTTNGAAVWTETTGGGGGQTNTVAGSSGLSNVGDNVDADLAPTYGSSANTVCQGNDARLSDSRPPNGSAGGDLAGSTYPNPTVAASAITNAKLADMVQATIKGRAAAAGTGAPVDLSSAQATAILDLFTSALKGLVPASGGGSTNFLRADGTWAAPTSSPTFGSQFQQGSSDGESTTTSGTFQQKLRVTTPSLPAGTYRIGWFYEWGKNAITDVATRVQVNDTVTCMNGYEEAVDAGSDQYFPRGGYYYYTGSGVMNIDLDYHANGTGTARIRRARLEIWRVS